GEGSRASRRGPSHPLRRLLPPGTDRALGGARMIGRISSRLAVSIALALLAGEPSAAAASCVASTHRVAATGPADERGRGGTGLAEEGGMGGTGIVGPVPGFGSICVNGLRVGYDPETPVDRAGQPIGAAGLRVGQHVVIRAMGAPSDLRAARITLLPAV